MGTMVVTWEENGGRVRDCSDFCGGGGCGRLLSRAMTYLVLMRTGKIWRGEHTGGCWHLGWRGRQGFRGHPEGSHFGLGNRSCYLYPCGHVGQEQRQMALGDKEDTAGQRLAEGGRPLRTMYSAPQTSKQDGSTEPSQPQPSF